MGVLTCSHGEALCPAGWLGCPAVESGGLSAVLMEKTAPRALTCQTALSLSQKIRHVWQPPSLGSPAGCSGVLIYSGCGRIDCDDCPSWLTEDSLRHRYRHCQSQTPSVFALRRTQPASCSSKPDLSRLPKDFVLLNSVFFELKQYGPVFSVFASH